MDRSAGTVNLRSFHVGVDLGQRQDHTAVVVVEQRVELTGRHDPVTYEHERRLRLVVTLVKRLRLGTEFHRIVAELRRLAQSFEPERATVTTTVDATGLGLVVSEQLQRERPRGELYPVVITGGQQGRYAAGYFPTPRSELLLGVQQALTTGGLSVARGVKGWEPLEDELKGIRKVPSAAGLRFETTGRHDDLVFALALALFGVRMRVLPVSGEALRRRL